MASGRCSVRLTRRYAASPEEVWRALTEKQSLRRWLDPRCEIELEQDAAFALGPEGSARITGQVRTIEAERVLELDWNAEGDASVVRFELTAEGDGTMLVVDHQLLDERVGMAYMPRWAHALDRLGEELGS